MNSLRKLYPHTLAASWRLMTWSHSSLCMIPYSSKVLNENARYLDISNHKSDIFKTICCNKKKEKIRLQLLFAIFFETKWNKFTSHHEWNINKWKVKKNAYKHFRMRTERYKRAKPLHTNVFSSDTHQYAWFHRSVTEKSKSGSLPMDPDAHPLTTKCSNHLASWSTNVTLFLGESPNTH